MNFWEYLESRHQQLLIDAYQHASVVFQCMVVATAIGVLIGILTYRSEWAGSLATTVTATLLTVPALAMIGLLIPIVGLGVAPTVIALTLYGLLPVVRNAIVGLRGVDPALVDAATGIGMSRLSRLVRVELPLAWPPILTGIRVSTQMLMGIAAIAAFASGPGLGNLIFRDRLPGQQERAEPGARRHPRDHRPGPAVRRRVRPDRTADHLQGIRA